MQSLDETHVGAVGGHVFTPVVWQQSPTPGGTGVGLTTNARIRFGFKMHVHNFPNLKMAVFPLDWDASGSSGALVKNEKEYKPSKEGTLIYFTSPSGDLSNELSRVEKAGGKILIKKKKIGGDNGFMAVILDTEGNRVAMHSRE